MQYRDAFAFLILIFILSIKPSGLLGKKSIVKV
jgi:branched-chain amino acid transport system permease protein